MHTIREFYLVNAAFVFRLYIWGIACWISMCMPWPFPLATSSKSCSSRMFIIKMLFTDRFKITHVLPDIDPQFFLLQSNYRGLLHWWIGFTFDWLFWASSFLLICYSSICFYHDHMPPLRAFSPSLIRMLMFWNKANFADQLKSVYDYCSCRNACYPKLTVFEFRHPEANIWK